MPHAGASRARSRLRALWRVVRWPAAVGAVTVVLLSLPVVYVETACRGSADPAAGAGTPLITDRAWHRREADTYLTYPEWHVVYAYDGLAAALARGDEHGADFATDVGDFWRATCALMGVADTHGGAGGDTRTMIHVIGVSFTLEMAVKGLYEETIGRVTAWWRGPEKTPQDLAIAAMARDYAAFLRQTPWYAYPFMREARRLWTLPAGLSVRSWERRIGIGIELTAKAAYGSLMGWAVAATAPATLEIRSIVAGLDPSRVAGLPDVEVVASREAGRIEIQTPRYARFTRVLAAIAAAGGTVVEIAGNDEVMVSMTTAAGTTALPARGVVLARLGRSGVGGERWLVSVPVRDLAVLFTAHPLGDPGLEHVYDY